MESNVGISADVQSPSNSRSRRASRRLVQCLRRNVSYGGHEYEVTRGCIQWVVLLGSERDSNHMALYTRFELSALGRRVGVMCVLAGSAPKRS
jgi:hypothetical protein